MITSGCDSMLSKVAKEVLAPDFDFSKLISKTSLIFSEEIAEIIDLFEKYHEEIGYNDTISVVESRLKPAVIFFSFVDDSVTVCKNDYYGDSLSTLNNKTIRLFTLDLKTIIDRNELKTLLFLEDHDRFSELNKIFTSIFEDNFSKTVSEALMYYSDLINKIVTCQDEHELSDTMLELNDLIRNNALPLSVLTKSELKSYLTFMLNGGNRKLYVPPFFILKTYHYLEDKQFKNGVKELASEIVSEFIQSKLLNEAVNGFLFIAEYRLFVDNSSFFKTLKNLLNLILELDYRSFDLDSYCKSSNRIDHFFINVFSYFIEQLTEYELDAAGDLLAFILENEIFVGDTNLESTTLNLSKKLGELNHKVSIKISGYLFNSYYEPFAYDLLNSKSISEVELQFENYSIIRLFQMEYSKKTIELISLIEANGIKLLLNQECTTSLRGLLIGLENGLVISQDENNKAHLEKFLSLLD